MNQQANRRWQFYSVCGHPGNLHNKKSMRISCRALAINEKKNRTNKRWKLVKKKGKLVRLGSSVKQTERRSNRKENKIDPVIEMTSLN